MAHTNETVNYHLSQFVGTDIPDPLVDYNGDMEKIDTAIKNVADSAVSETSRIVALETQNGNTPLTTTAQTISGAVNELDGEVGGIDTRLTTAEGKIVEDETTLGTAVGNISTLSGKVSALETKVGSAVLTTVASDCSGAINELDGEVGTLANLTTTAKNDVVSAINEVDAGVTALETQNGSAVLTTTAQTLSGAVNELDGEIGDLTSLDTTVKTSLVGAVNEVNDYIPTIRATASGATMSAALASLQTAYNALTNEEQLRSFITIENPSGEIANKLVFNSGTTGKYYRVNVDNALFLTEEYSIINQTDHTVRVRADSVVFEDHSSDSRDGTYPIKLWA